MRKGFTAYHDMRQGMRKLSDAECGRLFRALLWYSETGEQPDNLQGREELLFDVYAQSIDREVEAYEATCARNKANGSKNGMNPVAPTGSHSHPVAPTGSHSRQDKDKDEDKDEEKTKTKTESTETGARTAPAPVRHKYGQYDNVLLSEADMVKLRTEFPGDWAERIETLSAYMASKGVSYKNHLATIRNWARMEKERGQAKGGKTNPARDYSQREYDDSKLAHIGMTLEELTGGN